MNIQELARRETTPSEHEKFLPITKGPFLAVLGIFTLGGASLLYQFFRSLARLAARFRRADVP